MIAPEYFNNHIAVEGEIIVKRVPNDTGSVVVWNSSTKKLSIRTHAEIVSDLNVMTTHTDQNVEGAKWFRTSGGNAYLNHRLRIISEDGSNPGMVFYKSGFNAGTLQYDGNQYVFTNSDTNGYGLIVSDGYKKSGSGDTHVLLGGGGHKPLSDLALSSDLSNLVTKNTEQTITADKVFKKITTTDWVIPKFLAFPDASGALPNYIGFYLWNSQWQVNWRDASNTYLHPLLDIDGVSRNATFYGNTTAPKLTTPGGNSDQWNEAYSALSNHVTLNTDQGVTGKKIFYNQGQNFGELPLVVWGNNGSKGGIGFVKGGTDSAILNFDTEFHFTSNNNEGYKFINAAGVKVADSDDNHVLLGGGGNKSLDELVTTNTNQDVTGAKRFFTKGNTSSFADNALMAFSNDGSWPAMTFYRNVDSAGQIIFYGNYFGTLNESGNQFLNIKSQGFVKEGSDNNSILLGGGGHMPLSNFAGNDFQGYQDNRTIYPDELATKKLQFGFTSLNNNNGYPWADYIHFGGYQDASGGNQNLLMLNRNGFGIRQYQAPWQNNNPYAYFVDYWNTENFTQNDVDGWKNLVSSYSKSVRHTGQQTSNLVNYIPTENFTANIGFTPYNYQQKLSSDPNSANIHPDMYQGMMISGNDPINVHNFGLYVDQQSQLFVTGGVYDQFAWKKVWTEQHFSQADIDGWNNIANNGITTNTVQHITNRKFFDTYGISWGDNSLIVYAVSPVNPAMTFYKEGISIGQLGFDGGGFHFVRNDWSGYFPIKSDGFIKNGLDDNSLLLAGGGHKPLSNFALSSQLGDYWKKYTVAGSTGINASTPFGFLNGSEAQKAYMGGLLVSNYYGDNVNIPPNGAYILGLISTANDGNSAQWRQAYIWGNHADAGYVTLNIPQNIIARKAFTGGTDNTYTGSALQVNGNGSNIIPGISFHQPGVVASQIRMDNDGTVCIIDSSGGNYEKFRADIITASIFSSIASGNSSQWWEAYTWGDHADEGYFKNSYLNNKVHLANDAITEGTMMNYMPSNDAAKPPEVIDGSLLTLNYSSIWSTQLLGDWRTRELYYRTQENGTWNSFVKLFHSGNLNLNGFVKNTIDYYDVDATTETSWSHANVNMPTWFPVDQSGTVLHKQYSDSNYATQLALSYYNGIAYRHKQYGSWSNWKKIYTDDDLPSYDNWAGSMFINQRKVIGEIAWRAYGNDHTIFDASNSHTPSGNNTSNTDAQYPWVPTYPTLMGWNGSETFGVRVDSARVADRVNGYDLSTFAINSDLSGYYKINNGGPANDSELIPNGNQVISTGNSGSNFDGELSNKILEGTFANFNANGNTSKTLGFTLFAPTSTGQGVYYKTWYGGSTPWRRLIDSVDIQNYATQAQVNTKINALENAHAVGFSSGSSALPPYIYHSTDGYVFLATQNWSNDNLVTLQTDQNITGKKRFDVGYTNYTMDGLFSSDARPVAIRTPGGNDLLFGYKDYAGGQYYPRIGFTNSDASIAKWSLGALGNVFVLGTDNDDAQTFKFHKSGATSKTQNSTNIFYKVYQGYYDVGGHTGILAIKMPQASPNQAMFSIDINVYGYESQYLGKINVAFYKYVSGTVILNGSKALFDVTDNFPTTLARVGIGSDGYVSILLGQPDTFWNGYFSFEVAKVEVKYTNYTLDWSQGWTHTLETDISQYASNLITLPTDVGATRSWVDSNFVTNTALNNFVTTNTPQDINAQKTFRNTLRVVGANVNSNTTKLIIGNEAASNWWAFSAGDNYWSEDNFYIGTWHPNTSAWSPKISISNSGVIGTTNNNGTSENWKQAYDHMLPDQNWGGSTGIINRITVGEMAWKRYGNGHTIFDISSGTTPWNDSKSSVDAEIPWQNSFPTLVGGNGANTYGVRVDSARNADSLGNLSAGSYVAQSNLNTQLLGYAALNGVQTFTNTNTFTSSPVIPNGTLGTHAVNKNQIELSAGNEGENGQQLTISGNNSVHLTNFFVTSRDGSRNPDDIAPNSTSKRVRFDFAYSTSAGLGGSGNYAGIMTYSPWDGTSASTGDSSYQLAFANQTGVNGAGIPMLKIRKGIDGNWTSSWYKFWTQADFTITNIQQWNHIFQFGLRLNQIFSSSTGYELMISDDYFGNESGLVDAGFKNFVAGRFSEYYKYGSNVNGGLEGINYHLERQTIGIGGEADDNKVSVKGGVKATENFKSEEERADTIFIPDGNTASLRDEIINDDSEYAIRLDPHQYEIDHSGNLEVNDRNRLIHIIGEEIKMSVNFREIYPKQQIVIYNFDQKDYPMAVMIKGKHVYNIEPGSVLRLYVTKSLRVIVERQQPCEFIW